MAVESNTRAFTLLEPCPSWPLHGKVHFFLSRGSDQGREEGLERKRLISVICLLSVSTAQLAAYCVGVCGGGELSPSNPSLEDLQLLPAVYGVDCDHWS